MKTLRQNPLCRLSAAPDPRACRCLSFATFSLDGVLELTPRRYEDERGFFTETYNAACFAAKEDKIPELAGEIIVAASPRHLILRTSWVYSPFGTNFVKIYACGWQARVGKSRSSQTSAAIPRRRSILPPPFCAPPLRRVRAGHMIPITSREAALLHGPFGASCASSSRARGGHGRRFVT